MEGGWRGLILRASDLSSYRTCRRWVDAVASGIPKSEEIGIQGELQINEDSNTRVSGWRKYQECFGLLSSSLARCMSRFVATSSINLSFGKDLTVAQM